MKFIFGKTEKAEEPADVKLTFTHVKNDYYYCKITYGDKSLMSLYVRVADIDKIRSYYEALFGWDDSECVVSIMMDETNE